VVPAFLTNLQTPRNLPNFNESKMNVAGDASPFASKRLRQSFYSKPKEAICALSPMAKNQNRPKSSYITSTTLWPTVRQFAALIQPMLHPLLPFTTLRLRILPTK
jgi:hypothetical protein